MEHQATLHCRMKSRGFTRSQRGEAPSSCRQVIERNLRAFILGTLSAYRTGATIEAFRSVIVSLIDWFQRVRVEEHLTKSEPIDVFTTPNALRSDYSENKGSSLHASLTSMTADGILGTSSARIEVSSQRIWRFQL
jgi:hypothetical protein